MIKKIKELIAKRKQKKVQEAQLKKGKEYYKLLQCGANFLKYVSDDLAKQENGVNRKARRRMRLQLAKEGKFNAEIVNHYSTKIDNVLEYIRLEEVKKQNKQQEKANVPKVQNK